METRLDKTVFTKQSFKQADSNVKYWRTKTMSERLQAGYHLSLRAYGYDPEHPPKMDKSYFKAKRRNKYNMKQTIFERIEKELTTEGFTFERTDFERPWGGFFVIDEYQASQFIEKYFPSEKEETLTMGGTVSPKILVVAPLKRLSWQYHHRRSEVWIVIEGSVGVVRSDTDEEGVVVVHKVGDKIILTKGERHRLVGLDEYGILAEIWQHTDPDNLSDEDDIVRVQDDFGR